MEESDTFCLKWNDYQSSFLSEFEVLKEDEDFVDVTISCCGQSIKAHKVVLSACSPYLKKIFKENPCKHPVIILNNLTFTSLENVIQFIYTGQVYVEESELSAFVKAAEMLQISILSQSSNKKNCVVDGDSSLVSETVNEEPKDKQVDVECEVENSLGNTNLSYAIQEAEEQEENYIDYQTGYSDTLQMINDCEYSFDTEQSFETDKENFRIASFGGEDYTTSERKRKSPRPEKHHKKKSRKSTQYDMKVKIVRDQGTDKNTKELTSDLNPAPLTVTSAFEDDVRTENTMFSLDFNATVNKKRKDTIIHKMEKYLAAWINSQTQNGVPINFIVIKMKAINLFESLRVQEGENSKVKFTASSRWFRGFMNRLNLNSRINGDLMCE